MPARCPGCGEEALTDTARFCVGCGGPLPEADHHIVVAELADAPSVVAEEPSAPPRDSSRRLAPGLPPLRDPAPLVPLALVIAGIVGVVALLLVLLLAA